MLANKHRASEDVTNSTFANLIQNFDAVGVNLSGNTLHNVACRVKVSIERNSSQGLQSGIIIIILIVIIITMMDSRAG